MKYIKFNDSQIDSFLFMQLADLTKTLARNEEAQVEYGVHSYYNPLENKVYLSHFWNHRPYEDMVAGLKSDAYIRTAGYLYHTDYLVVKKFMDTSSRLSFPSFGRQLFAMLEDLRLEDVCKEKRPGTKKAFSRRRTMLRTHFKTQQKLNVERGIFTDALLCSFYLKATAETPLDDVPPIHPLFDLAMPFLTSELLKVFEAVDTADTAKISGVMMDVLEELLERDMLNTYFYMPDLQYEEMESHLAFDDLKRKSKLSNDDKLDKQQDENDDVHEDKLPTWHSETSKATQSFLQFDLEQGSKTEMLGDGAREGDDHDQALGTVQGSSRSTTKNDYSNLEALEAKQEQSNPGNNDLFGKENKHALPVFTGSRAPDSDEITLYKKYQSEVAPLQKKLKQMIQRMLEHKKILPRSDLHVGRLGKKLLKAVTDENPRLFYKKNQPSSQIDAVFTLLVDCSASMYDKMDETKLGITLFHEALKSVRVPHQVVGFWEDTNEASPDYQPNHFYTAVDFQSSLKMKTGPEILQLQPQEDNRDGYAIRHMTKQLLARTEEQKFLLVFSDGEPAAMNYEQNGIVDTHEAVVEARKNGIEVINVFLSNGEIEESQQKTIQNIYGKYSILVPEVDRLADILFPLLKKLLRKSIE
ncbi:VWA domain-containing protein [Bacillus lacus]|uniref:VWA domain-containing protein n=1 Tax=Metabacillus lacus TaxID=1983721 RepID=A0A7X2J0L5_9BACI|nr:VWA domain-containing protein [Metabacillus lacus]MRX72927.1 VWA domain-containing protein [Metabacillus lacus]